MAHKFTNDYSELVHKDILDALLENLNKQHIAYGLDSHSANAKELIKKTFNLKAGDNVVLTGGQINGAPGNTNTIKVETVK